MTAARAAITQAVRMLTRLPDTLMGRLVDAAWARIFAELEARQRREWSDTLAFLARWQPEGQQPEHPGADGAAVSPLAAAAAPVSAASVEVDARGGEDRR